MSGAAENEHAAESGGDRAPETARDRGYIHTHTHISLVLVHTVHKIACVLTGGLGVVSANAPEVVSAGGREAAAKGEGQTFKI